MKAVIFDMDGVLILTGQFHFQLINVVVENFQLKIDEEEFVKFFLGRTSRESFTDFLKAQNKDEILIKKALISFEKLKQDVLENKMESNLPLRRYTQEFLKKLKAGGYRLAIATSTKRSFTDDIIRELDLEKYFDITVAGDEVKFSKPDPEIYLKAAKKLGVDPMDCLVIEDAPAGVIAAKKAGMKCFGMLNEDLKADLSKADKIVSSFEEAEKELGL